MKIETKYDIGHRFWVPRSRKEYKTKNIVIDGETYSKNEPYYNYTVKEKEIIHIEVNVYNNTPIIRYQCKNIGEKEYYIGGWVGEDEIHNYNKNEAKMIAKYHADMHEVFYGY